MTEEKKLILAHEPVPGYPKIFAFVLVIAIIHLGFIFLRSLF